jgi:diacylglycerol kinase (ATP)
VPSAPLIVVNPAAGNGSALRLVAWIREQIASRPDTTLVITDRPGDAETRVTLAVREGRERVVAVGGDGTVQEVVNGLLTGDAPAELGIVPVGTGNDLARSLGLATDPAEAWTAALGPATRPLDVGRARNGEGLERWFASAGGLGFDAQVAAAVATRRGWQAGRAGYLLTTLSELRRFENRRVRLTVDDATIEGDVLLVAFANGEFYGGGMRIAPGARTDDGRIDVCVVGDISRLTAIRQLPNLYRGTHVGHPAVRMLSGSNLEVDGDPRARVHLDGEPFGTLPLSVAVEGGRLRIAVR